METVFKQNLEASQMIMIGESSKALSILQEFSSTQLNNCIKRCDFLLKKAGRKLSEAQRNVLHTKIDLCKVIIKTSNLQ